MNLSVLNRLGAGASVVFLALGAAGCGHPHGIGGHHAGTMAAGPAGADAVTLNLQGYTEAHSWMSDPHMHAFYEATLEAFAGGAANVDAAAYEAKARAIFQTFALSRHMDPAAMQDHLKAIPRQMIAIATEDPIVLDSYEAFTVALFGPP